MSVYQKISKGLGSIFNGQILRICSVIPFIGWILNLVGLILILLGLKGVGNQHENYKKAFQYTLINFVVTFLASVVGFFDFASTGVAVLAVLLEVGSYALAFGVFMYVCQTTAEFIQMQEWTDKAQKVVKIYGIIYIICAATSVLGLIPLFSFLTSGFFDFVINVLSIVGAILYLMFLNGARKVLSQKQEVID